MSKFAKKSFYIVATKNGQHFYQEGDYSEQEINRWINEFDIDEFLADESTDEEFTGPAEGTYAIYRQASMTMEESLAIGHFVRDGDTISTHFNETEEQKAYYDKRCAEISAEIDAEFGDEEPLVHFGSFAKVVA